MQQPRKLTQLFLALVALAGMSSMASAEMSEQCAYNIFPIYAGGSKKEQVNCFVYDPKNEMIIVGGSTNSEDFAPAANDHGYLFALDMAGNWQWGKFFYNVSYAVSDISGCQLSSDGQSLTVFGQGNSQPVIMDMETKDGAIKKYISLEYKDTSEEVVPVYKTYGGLYHDKVDYYDSKEYFYSAFEKDGKIEFLRLINLDEPIVDWSFEFYLYTLEETSDEFYRTQVPQFLHPDPRDDQVLYLSGQYQGAASIMRFQKRDAKLRYWIQFEKLSNIRAYAQVPEDDHFYACGDYNTQAQFTDTTLTGYTAGMFRIQNTGEIKWYIEATGSNPVNTAFNADRCFGVAYHQRPNLRGDEISFLLQIKMSELRYFTPGDFYDTLLLVLDPSGNVHNAVSISNRQTQYDMNQANNGLFMVGDQHFFAGWAYGFSTRLQSLTKDAASPDYDAYIYKYVFQRDSDQQSNCLYEQIISVSEASKQLNKISSSDLAAENIYRRWTENNKVRKTRTHDYFFPYTSRYSGGFSLMDTMKIPRPCAFKSYNLTSVDYYRGQRALPYKISSSNNTAGFVVTLMNSDTEFIFQDGSPADPVATYDQSTYSVFIQTDEEDHVGVQKTIIRNCDSLNRLLELNLYIQVLSNSHPDFEKEIETSFTLSVGDVYEYKLPPLKDNDGNDVPVVEIKKMDAQEDKFPDFMLYENDTNTIIFRPVDEYLAGHTYYFTIVVREENSDTVSYPYYCTIKMNGEIRERDNSINYTDVNYTINYIDEHSEGSLKFTSPVNLTFVNDNFFDMFKVFWRDTTYRVNKENKTLENFEVHTLGDDNMTMNFTMTFETPYMLGLLIKKSDKLYIEVNEGFNYSGMFLGNATEHRLITNSAHIRIEMIFDWRNGNMMLMRNISKNMYWVMVGVVLTQFVLLIWRGVGLLPVWILIEYMQLVAFMPIYNFRLIPYLYDAFKPCLISHMIIFDETPFYPDLDNDFFNKNYEYYWLSVGRLSQSFFFIIFFLVCILIANLVMFILYRMNLQNPTMNAWVKKKMTQFKFNVYIRFYMLIYFDSTFFSVMKIIEGNNSTAARKMALLLSYVLFLVSIVLPLFLITLILRRFEILKIKQAKESFNTLLLKIDKASKWRAMNPAYFFGRRLLTAMLLTLPIDNTFIFLQYVFILMSSHAYILYMVACKPFQTPGINTYVLSNETFYSALIIAIFIFSDATPELNIKFGAGVALMTSLILLVLANIIQNIIYMIKGKDSLKKSIKESKLKRAEKEALERAEEEERRLKKKKEEEEFTKLPDDTANLSQIDPSNTTNNNTTLSELNLKSNKKRKKKVDDNVTEAAIGGVQESDFPGSKKNRRRGKDKGKQDDLTEGQIPGDPPKKSKSRKDTTTHGTDFGTNPTQKDFL